MPKAVVTIGYARYVMNLEEAVAVATALANAEQLERVGYGSNAAYYIWPQEGEGPTNIGTISDEMYALGRLAGKKPKDA